MVEFLSIASVALLLLAIGLLILLLKKNGRTDFTPLLARLENMEKGQERTERTIKEEVSNNREETARQGTALRGELGTHLKNFNDSVLKQLSEIANLQKNQLDAFVDRLTAISESTDEKLGALRVALEKELKLLMEENAKRLDQMRQDAATNAKQAREETAAALTSANDSMVKTMGEMAKILKGQMEGFSTQLRLLTENNEKRAIELRNTVESKLVQIQTDNSAKLEQMRITVDEKLQGTLDQRLGESFKLVSERLEQVHKGLGEMQNLATGVGDLKRVLTNVKTRGTWGEVQLGNLLEQILTPDQYARNVKTKPTGQELVEFAIKLPGRDEDDGKPVWLPIDAKFPKEDYERLVDAAERGDVEAVDQAAKNLDVRVRSQARDIRDKYIAPPHTTDFGLLYLPTEGLYAEVLRRPGLADTLQREYRIVIVGPTTLAALLNSLQMGFHTLVIQKRSSEVWKVLAAVKDDFGKFGNLLDNVKKKLDETGETIDKALHRSRQLERKLKKVESLPVTEAKALLSDVQSPDLDLELQEEAPEKII